jgi:HlyD family secretion protein
MKKAVIGVLFVAAIGAGVGAYYVRRGNTELQINTAPVTRGDIVDSVGATGTLQAVTTVMVGSQLSGNISWLGADFNSIVKKGQVIARVEPSVFEAQLQQARANLAQARANLVKAQSDLERTKVQLTDAQQKYSRAKELGSRQLLPQSELDAAKVAVDTAEAMLASQQATVTQAQAGVAQSQAQVNQNQVNLDHTVIVAPIDGIVTQRSVDVGQTVAASMQAPILFVIAADLTKMQVNANIDEADVGRIRPGQHVTFHVDAYPTESFDGTVSQVRLQPVVVQNVTTYGTVIDVPNPELKLKPGMTANVKVEIAKRSGALRVPNAALRFRPTPEVFAALNQVVPPEAGGNRGGRGTQQRTATGTTGAEAVPAPTGSTGEQSRPDQGRGPSAGSGQGGEGRGNFDPARAMERFKAMSPDEQQQFIARMKERGRDTTAFEAAKSSPSPAAKEKKAAGGSAQTIDALFAPLATTETRGRAWLFMNHQLKPVNMRLGISDGTHTEILSSELQENMEVVTSATGTGTSTRTLPQGGTGNPLLPGGRGPGGFQGGRGR